MPGNFISEIIVTLDFPAILSSRDIPAIVNLVPSASLHPTESSCFYSLGAAGNRLNSGVLIEYWYFVILHSSDYTIDLI